MVVPIKELKTKRPNVVQEALKCLEEEIDACLVNNCHKNYAKYPLPRKHLDKLPSAKPFQELLDKYRSAGYEVELWTGVTDKDVTEKIDVKNKPALWSNAHLEFRYD